MESFTKCKGRGKRQKRGHIVADTNVSPFARARNICCGHKRMFLILFRNILSSGTQNCFWFCSETFCVRIKCFPVCAAQETSWATMCPQQCVLVCQGLKVNLLQPHKVKNRFSYIELRIRRTTAFSPLCIDYRTLKTKKNIHLLFSKILALFPFPFFFKNVEKLVKNRE